MQAASVYHGGQKKKLWRIENHFSHLQGSAYGEEAWRVSSQISRGTYPFFLRNGRGVKYLINDLVGVRSSLFLLRSRGVSRGKTQKTVKKRSERVGIIGTSACRPERRKVTEIPSEKTAPLFNREFPGNARNEFFVDCYAGKRVKAGGDHHRGGE